MPEQESRISSLDWALGRVGDRWTLLIVGALLDGPKRFNELGDAVHGVAPNILTKRLRALEADGLLLARRYRDRPPRFRYELTEPGRELGDALAVLAAWGARNGAGTDPLERFHAACGTALEAKPWCPTCEETIALDDALIWV